MTDRHPDLHGQPDTPNPPGALDAAHEHAVPFPPSLSSAPPSPFSAPSRSERADRRRALRNGVRIEILTVAWMVVEAAVSVGAGVVAGSLLLTAFGIDSVIELVSGGVLLWRLSVQARGGSSERVERAERRAAWVVAVSLALLCIYVLGTAIYGLLARSKPDASLVGIGVSAAAVLVMPWLGVTKRRLATPLDSSALRGDAASSFTCGYMAATVLVGLLLNVLFHWWWAEYLAAVVFLFWLVGETREALEEARAPGEEGAQVDEGCVV